LRTWKAPYHLLMFLNSIMAISGCPFNASDKLQAASYKFARLGM
jgi:hypothetical protein